MKWITGPTSLASVFVKEPGLVKVCDGWFCAKRELFSGKREPRQGKALKISVPAMCPADGGSGASHK